jgi:hypothetical protein
VGLVFTAVYNLWRIGLISGGSQQGSSIDGEAWFVVIAAGSFIVGRWFGVSAPVAIVGGGLLGMIWYGVVS